MAYDVAQLLAKSDAELDFLFQESQSGPIPNGPARGVAIAANATSFGTIIARIVNTWLWKGKTFDATRQMLRNRVSIFGLNAIAADIYHGESLLDGKACIVLDYSKRAIFVKSLRDEVRMIAPNTYLGRVYWRNKPTIHFALQFEE